MTTCPNCGGVNPDSAQFCSNCGFSLIDPCVNCGSQLTAGARFCPTCGTPVVASEPKTQERKLVSIVFADVTGSTGLGEQFDPEDLEMVMSAYFDAMRTELEAEGGTVEKFIGDAVMAVFGVPVAHEDDPARAIRAALRMMERLAEVNKELVERQGVSLQMRVGINTGEVLANTTARPGEPLVTGDVVNAAARLQTTAAPDQILVAERTARAVRGFTFSDVSELRLRGKSIPMNALELLGPDTGASERGIVGLQSAMIGRDAEMALLKTVYERATSESRPNLVTVYGVAGVGKSRLTREFLDWVQSTEPTPTVVRGRCLPYGDGVAYWPLAEILKQVTGIRDSDPTEDTLGRIRALGDAVLTPELTTDAEATVAALANTMGVRDPAHSMAGLDPREVRARTKSAWRSLFTGLSDRAPVVAVIEDIHWADPALLDILEELTDKVRGCMMLLCPARPELADRRLDWGAGHRSHTSIFLDPLTPEQSSTLVSSLLTVAELPESVRESMMNKAEGNPFFLEEIIRHFIDQGVLVRDGDAWRSSSDAVSVVVPDTVQGVLAARIDLLEPEEKRVLQLAAVVGRTFWPGPVTQLVGLDTGDVVGIFDQLEDRELIRSRLGSSFTNQPEYVFKHVLTRDVAYESLTRRERGDAHAAVAGWIESETRNQGEELVELVAHHWTQAHHAAAEDPSAGADVIEMRRLKAFEFNISASEASLERAAGLKAVSLSEEALSLADSPLDRGRALTARGTAALFNYAGDLSWFSLRDAADIFIEHAPHDRRLIARTCARAVETPTRWPGSMKAIATQDEVNRYIEIGLAQLDPDEESEEMARLLLAKSMELFGTWFGHDDVTATAIESRASAERAAAIASAIGRPDLASASLDALGSIETSLGDLVANTRVIERRLEIVEHLTNPWEIGDALAMGAWNYGYIGDYRRGLALANRGVVVAGDEGPGVSLHNVAWASFAEFWLGNWDRVVGQLSDRARSTLSARGSEHPPYFSGHHFGADAFIHVARRDGEAARASELLFTVIEEAKVVESREIGAMWRIWGAWVKARSGAVTEARSQLVALAAQPIARPIADVVISEILLDGRKFDELDTFAVASREFAIAGGIDIILPHLTRLEAARDLGTGDTEKARTGLAEARAIFERQGMTWDTARTDLWLAEAHLAAGDAASASTALQSARSVLEELGSLPEIERARSLVARL